LSLSFSIHKQAADVDGVMEPTNPYAASKAAAELIVRYVTTSVSIHVEAE
jgi:dTDP-D-glucose 4,6-dehydratase